eukprot:8437890-Pyramimonas_sp.AAC.1
MSVFVPTLRILLNAKAGAAPWLPVEQGNAMDVTGPSPRGRPPVAWANSFVARPRRASQSVSRRINLCSDHRLVSVCKHTAPAAGPTATA